MHENTDLRSAMAQVAGSAAFAGVLMVVVGFRFYYIGISTSAIYNHATDLFYWTMRIGGIAMLAIAVVAYLGWRPILAVDMVVTIATGLVMIGVALIWLMNDDLIDGVLSLLFGGMFVRSGLQSWALFRSSTPFEPVAEVDASPVPVEEPPVENGSGKKGLAASLRAARKQADRKDEQIVMPKPGEPDPEGFLADLGRTSEEGKG